MTAAIHLFRPETRGDNRVETPGPGVYPDVPMDVYHAWQAASNSRLTKLMRSPAHLKAYLDAPPDDTVALKQGRAIHTAVLEPDDFTSRYVIAQQCQATTKKLEQCSKTGSLFHPSIGWRCGTHGIEFPLALMKDAPLVLKEDDHRMCLGIRDAVHVHSAAGGLLRGTVAVEQSMVCSLKWSDDVGRFVRHDADGVSCKIRPDAIAEFAGGTFLDVKSTRDASRDAFERPIFAFGYHRQAALYLDHARALGVSAEHFVIVAVEKEAPYAVAVYRLTEGALEGGRDQLRPLLDRYADCLARNEWPGYGNDVVDISLPDWAWHKITEELREHL